MPITRPTFSESWHRVQHLKARLRPSAQIHRQFYRGERWYVVRDPAGNQYHRLSDAAYRFVGLLDGRRSVEEAWQQAGGALADDAPTQPEVIQILSQLFAANLLDADISPDATVLLRRQKQQMKKRVQGRLLSALFPRIPLWDPDRFLKRWLPAVGWVFGPLGMLIWLAVVVTAVAMLGPRYDDLVAAGANTIRDPSSWPLLFATFVLTKLIHELGHGFSCRRFGGEVHEMGIMFLVFIPTPYVDASSAWQFSNKWKRIFVGAAGMYVELFVAAIAAFIWLNTNAAYAPWGIPVNELAYNAMLIASVSTILFNANPLLRYDGYYMLSDWLEIPNLQQKSRDYTLGLIKRHVYRVRLPQPLPPAMQRVWLLSYNILSSIYRIFIGVLIIVTVAFAVPILGMVMAIGGVVTWLVVPVVKLLKYHLLDPELHRKRGRGLAFCGSVAAALVLLIGVMPVSMSLYPEGEVAPFAEQTLRNEVDGFVAEVLVADGQRVQAGDAVLRLHSPELTREIAQLRATLRELQARHDLAAETEIVQMRSFREQMGAVQTMLDDALRREALLTVRASIDGQLAAPDLPHLAGRFVRRGEALGMVLNTDRLRIRIRVQQQDAELALQLAGEPEVRLSSAPSIGHVGRDLHVVPALNRELRSSALGWGGGGQIAPDPTDTTGRRSAQGTLPLELTLDNPDQAVVPGQRAYIRLPLESRPLIWQWSRRFWQLLQTRSDDTWI